MKTFLAFIGGMVSWSGPVILMPFISFWMAYFGGWLCYLVIGDVRANGLNQLFNTSHFTKELIPLCAATLGWIGGYFKCRATTSSSD